MRKSNQLNRQSKFKLMEWNAEGGDWINVYDMNNNWSTTISLSVCLQCSFLIGKQIIITSSQVLLMSIILEIEIEAMG